MANYLERVATSAGRRAAIAKPPASGPPLLPTSKDLSLPVEESLLSDEFFEASTDDRRESTRSEEPRDTIPGETKMPSPEPLSSEPPFILHLPKTLRPVSSTKDDLDPSVRPTASPVQTRSTESNDGRPQRATPTNMPQGLVTDTPRESFTNTPRANIQPANTQPESFVGAALRGRPSAGPSEEPDRHDRPEPLPPAVSPVPMPAPVGRNEARQEQSRISIGSLEVMVNNHPPLKPVKPPAPAPSRGESLNLEKRYLDRFRLRH